MVLRKGQKRRRREEEAKTVIDLKVVIATVNLLKTLEEGTVKVVVEMICLDVRIIQVATDKTLHDQIKISGQMLNHALESDQG